MLQQRISVRPDSFYLKQSREGGKHCRTSYRLVALSCDMVQDKCRARHVLPIDGLDRGFVRLVDLSRWTRLLRCCSQVMRHDLGQHSLLLF
jgi:hypothetical protein